jgi:hypothetical protein
VLAAHLILETTVSKPRPPRDTRLRNALFFITVVAAIVVGRWLAI